MAASPSSATGPAASMQLLRWRSRTQVFVERHDGLEVPMVRIPAGRFAMGSPEGEEGRSESEGPVHEVRLGEFLMGRTPITQEQWRAVAMWEPRESERWGRKLEPHPSRHGSWEGSMPINRIFLSTSPAFLADSDRVRSCRKAAEQAISMVGNVHADSDWPGDGRSKPPELSADLIGRCQLFVGLPRLVFVLDSDAADAKLPEEVRADLGDGERQRAFLQRIADSGLHLQRFRTPKQLTALLVEALRPYAAEAHPDRLLPVEQVSWEEAMEFCSRLSQRTGRYYTLPSEAQWEYACRAGTSTPFAFGEMLSDELANYAASKTYGSGPKGAYREHTTPVGTFPANAWGVEDMHGNVWEWCLDHWHGSYEGAPEDGSAWLKDSTGETEDRLLRGGAQFYSPRGCRSASRYHGQAVIAGDDFGFRVVCLPQGPSLNP